MANPNAPWSGRRVTEARGVVATWLPAGCGKCGGLVVAEDDWVVGHKKSRVSHPHLTWVVSNWQPEHRACSDASGQAAVIEKAKLDALAEVGVFPGQGTDGKPPPLPFSPPGGLGVVDGWQPPLALGLPASLGHQFEVRDGLAWDPDRLLDYPWLAEFAVVPDDASPPLWMSLPAEDAVGSYGAEAIAWIEETQRLRLRWWQRLAITRQLERRADGSLCYREFIDSAPRRAGKSVRMRGVALWRMGPGAEIFAEPQLVMHTGSDIAICREIQRGAWRWAEDVAGWEVTRANGKEQIESDEGHRWLVRAQTAVYGYDVTLGMVDEGWDVKPETVDEGLEPATLERISPQLHITSTAHRRATSMMRGRLVAALTADDPKTAIVVWGAPQGSDPSDPDVWRAASPHWSEDRHALIASKYERAAAGQADPQADDPDPMAGFMAQYLNVWRLGERSVVHGDPLVDEHAWTALAVKRPLTPPNAAAIESWFAAGVSLARAWNVGGVQVVTASDHPNVDAAVAALRASGFRGVVTVGASLVDDPALRKVRTKSGEKRTAAAALELQRLIAEGVVAHDGGVHLSEQVVAVRTVDGADGPRIVSKGRADAVKAATWAITSSRLTRRAKRRLHVPSGV